MIGLKRYIVALPVVVYLIFASHVDASYDFCVTAMDKELCKKMVEGATYWDEAATKAITAATQDLAKAMESGNPACKNLMESLETVGTIREGDKVGSLDLKLAAALTSLDDCTKALKGEPDASAAKILNHSVEEAIRVCLAVSSSKVAASSSKSANSNASPSFSLIS
nr:uncharacterized protein LOC109179521 isoform X1 [Ipomoea trifida]